MLVVVLRVYISPEVKQNNKNIRAQYPLSLFPCCILLFLKLYVSCILILD